MQLTSYENLSIDKKIISRAKRKQSQRFEILNINESISRPNIQMERKVI